MVLADTDGGARTPERPDAVAQAPPGPPSPTRARMSRGAIAMIVLACVVAVIGTALAIVLAVNSVGNSAEDQFKQIQYCLDHPHAQACQPNEPSP